MGYWFGKEYWGQGYATETVKALIEVCKDLGLNKISAFVNEYNKTSVSVLEKSGFKFVEAKENTGLDSNGQPVNELIYECKI